MTWKEVPMTEEEYIAVDDAAERLGVSRATAWNLIKRHGLQTYRRPGERRTLLRRADVDTLAAPMPTEDAKKIAA
jgi:putative transposase